MPPGYKVASLVILCISVIFGTTSWLVVNSENVQKNDDAFTALIAAPSEVLKLTITGIFGFITGSATEISKNRKREDDEEYTLLKERLTQLEKENEELRNSENF